MNYTHVQYYYHTEAPATSYGSYEPRVSYNASGLCDDCFCSGTCVVSAHLFASPSQMFSITYTELSLPSARIVQDFSSEPRYVNEYNLCTPCHRLTQSHIDHIMSDPFEEVSPRRLAHGGSFTLSLARALASVSLLNLGSRPLSRSFIPPPQVHFREVGAILFENCDAGRFFDSDTFYRTGSLELACTQCPPGRFNARSNKLPECELCQAGTYYPDYGATKCIR